MFYMANVFYPGNPNAEKSPPLLPTLLHTRKLQYAPLNGENT